MKIVFTNKWSIKGKHIERQYMSQDESTRR